LAQVDEEQLDQIRDERREQIKRAALKVFARRGIAGTKMSMIAAEAGISQGLSYRYFSSKDELFTELVQEAMEGAHTALANIDHLPGTPVEQIRTLTVQMLDESNRLSFLLIQQAQMSDEVPEKAKQIIQQYFFSQVLADQLIPIFIKGQRTGEFCTGDPQRLLFCYFSVISGLMLQDVEADKSPWMEEIDILMKILTK
jgi:TetR/AcrR family transcriptional regulator, regulator of autoinduction and epiphytic fitness